MSVDQTSLKNISRNKNKDYEIADCEKLLERLHTEAQNYASDLDKNLKLRNKKCSDVSGNKLISTVEEIYKQEKHLCLLKTQAGWKYESGKYIQPDDYDWNLMARDMSFGRI